MQNKRIISTANMVQKISEEFNITLKDSKLIVDFLILSKVANKLI